MVGFFSSAMTGWDMDQRGLCYLLKANNGNMEASTVEVKSGLPIGTIAMNGLERERTDAGSYTRRVCNESVGDESPC